MKIGQHNWRYKMLPQDARIGASISFCGMSHSPMKVIEEYTQGTIIVR